MKPLPTCPECQSVDLVKFGRYNDSQKYHCNDCGLTTIYPNFKIANTVNKKRKFINRKGGAIDSLRSSKEK